MGQFRKRYSAAFFKLVRGFFLVICGFCIFWTLLAVLDLSFDLGWGYSWGMVPIGLGMAAAAYGGSLFIAVVGRVVSHFDG